DLLDERGIAGVVDVAEREQPVQRIVLGGDEAVEARGGVVLGLHAGRALRPAASRGSRARRSTTRRRCGTRTPGRSGGRRGGRGRASARPPASRSSWKC